jgi:ABC-type antimicrobial peptide transport system permease subunit
MSVYRSLDVIGMELALLYDGQSLPAVRIVGVAKDFETSSSRKVGPPVVYLPLAQHYEPFITFTAPGTTNPNRAIAALRDAVHAGAPSMAIVVSGAGTEVLHPESGPLRMATAMLIILGCVGVTLAAGGLYGVVSYLTEQRKRELGIRIALGATRNQILRLVIAGGIRPLVEGLALGIGCAIVVRAIGSQYSVGGAILDPILLISAVPVITAGVLACWIPALRAARREPLVALRCD